ncbi:NAD-dependent epimerase/dehydratase family protein [Pelagibacterales bacterium]|nr:NAD-dependent epimerase/dehydratase family protein [Pelagibacterales bacterium]
MDLNITDNTPHLLVVGGTGFIGSNLCDAAIKKGWKVTSLSLNKKKIIDSSNLNKSIIYLSADIAQEDSLKAAFINNKYDYIINMGGYVNHSNFYDDGKKIIDTHFNGLLNLIRNIDFSYCKKFINTGSSDEYGDIVGPQEESMLPLPNSAYAFSKYAGNNFLEYLFRSEKLPVCGIRLFLVYGPGQNKQRFLPQIIKGCLEKKSFPVSEGNQIRDFCYIDDVVEAIFRIFENATTSGHIFNIASGDPIKIKEMILKVKNVIGYGSPSFGDVSYKKNENMSLYANISKIKKFTEWKPVVNLDDGINKTVSHYINSYE